MRIFWQKKREKGGREHYYVGIFIHSFDKELMALSVLGKQKRSRAFRKWFFFFAKSAFVDFLSTLRRPHDGHAQRLLQREQRQRHGRRRRRHRQQARPTRQREQRRRRLRPPGVPGRAPGHGELHGVVDVAAQLADDATAAAKTTVSQSSSTREHSIPATWEMLLMMVFKI